MPTRTYTVVVEWDCLARQYVARVGALPTVEARGRTSACAIDRIKEAIVTALVAARNEPDFAGYPRDHPNPRVVKVEVVLPIPVQEIIDRIVPPAALPDNVTPLRPRR